MPSLTTYLAAQTILFVLFSMLFLAAHRRLLTSAWYRRWLDEAGGSGVQWLFVFPVATCAYAAPAGILFGISGQALGSLLPAAIGAGAGLVAKNLLYAVMPRKPQLEAWDGAAFVLIVGLVGSWIFAGASVGLPAWLVWFGANEVLAGFVIILSIRVFRIAGPASAPPPARKPKSPDKGQR